MDWQFLPFEALSLHQLYALLQLRSAVFVQEQACIFQDIDGADAQALHVLGLQGDQLLAYARCFLPRQPAEPACIGRVVVAPSVRRTGLGHALMRQALQYLGQYPNIRTVRLSAQVQWTNFYRQHGFAPVGEVYLEDGIAHIEMQRACA